MAEEITIQRRWGTTSRPLNIAGWELGEWDQKGDQPKRIITDPGGNKWYDYLGSDGLHDLIKYIKSPEFKQEQQNIKEEEREVSPEKVLYDFVIELGITFCSDQFANNCCIYKNKYYVLDSREIKAEIASLYFEMKESVFSDATWNKFISIISNKCIVNPKTFPIRCHTDGQNIYYDTGFSVWRFSQDTEIGFTVESAPVTFRRYNHQVKADIQPTDKTAKELIEEVAKIFNIEDFRPETIPILFCTTHPNPIYLLGGDAGAAKSTFSMFLKMLVDPNNADKLELPDPNDMENFGLHRQNFYIIVYDNVKAIYQKQSDELCRMVTGGTTLARKLYTNGELYITKGMPRIVLNGLRPEPSSFNDLLDRTLMFDMRRVKSRPESVVWAELNSIIPQLRYACLRDLSKAVVLAYDQEFPKLPRMSEHCLLGESLNVLWGGELGSYVDWFNRRMDIAHASGMDDPLTVVLTEYLLQNKAYLDTGLSYTTSEWRFKLVEWAAEKEVILDGIKEYRTNKPLRPSMQMCIEEKEFPKNATWLGRRFRDLTPLMELLGYSIKVIRSSKENFVEIRNKKV